MSTALINRITSSRQVQAAGASANAGEIVPGPDINGTPIGKIVRAGSTAKPLLNDAGCLSSSLNPKGSRISHHQHSQVGEHLWTTDTPQ